MTHGGDTDFNNKIKVSWPVLIKKSARVRQLSGGTKANISSVNCKNSGVKEDQSEVRNIKTVNSDKTP